MDAESPPQLIEGDEGWREKDGEQGGGGASLRGEHRGRGMASKDVLVDAFVVVWSICYSELHNVSV